MKFIADSCSNFSFPAVEADVSIRTAIYNGNVCERSSENVSICWGTLSSRIMKSSFVKPGTNCPFLSTTVMGNRTRRIGILTDSWLWSEITGVGLAVGLGFCAYAPAAAAKAQTTKQKLNNRRVKPNDIVQGL